jgi:hypothetical protein
MEVGHARRGEKSATPTTTGPANMSNQRLVIVAVGVLLVMGGLFALRFPVFVGDVDQWGFQINCGNGFQSALTQAVIADSAGTHFVDRCPTALAMRRGWTIALAVTGALLVGTADQTAASALLELPAGSGTSIDVTIPRAAPRRGATKSSTNLKSRKGIHVQ